MTRRNRSTQTQTQNNTTTDPKTEPDSTVNTDTPDTSDATPQSTQDDIPTIDELDYIDELLISSGLNGFKEFILTLKAKDPIVHLGNLGGLAQSRIYLAGQVVYAVKTKSPAIQENVNPESLKALRSYVKELDERIMLKILRHLARNIARATDEIHKSYRDFGPFYAGTPLGVDVGIEIGFATGEGAKKQRSGLIVGLRSDNLRKVQPAEHLSVGIS